MKTNILLLMILSFLSDCTGDKRFKPEVYFEGQEVNIAEAIYYDNEKELLKWLQRGEVDINTPGKQGFTYLMYAIYCERFDMVKTLLEQGADPNQIAYVTFIRSNGSTSRRPEVLNPLTVVSQYDYDIKYMKLLIQYGAKINNPQTYSPLHKAILHLPFGHKLSGKQMKKIHYLLDHGADVNMVDIEGTTSILEAACIRDFDMINFLWERGADPLYIDPDGASVGYYLQEELDLNLGTPEQKRKVQDLIRRLEKLGVEFPVKLQKPEKKKEPESSQTDLTNNIIVDN